MLQIKSNPLFAIGILLVLCLLSSKANTQSACQDCYTNDTSRYQCNGRSCIAFFWPTNKTSPSGIECQQSRYDCYWSKNSTSRPNFYLYTACNYSIDYCSDCRNQTMCYNCQIGYCPYASGSYGLDTCRKCSDVLDKNCLECSDIYTCTSCAYGFMRISNYSTGKSITTCLKCSSAIPGCITCDGRSSCTSCELDYIPIGGLCYQKDGKTLANAIDFQYLLTNQTDAGNKLQQDNNKLQQDMNGLLSQIFIALIILIVVLFFGILTVCWTSRKSTKALEKRSILSSHD